MVIMGELIGSIIVIGIFVWLAKGTEWRSNNRTKYDRPKKK